MVWIWRIMFVDEVKYDFGNCRAGRYVKMGSFSDFLQICSEWNKI